jgi:hypothetical protein
MKNTEGLLRASCAADALLNVVPRVRKGYIGAFKGMRLLLEMTDRPSIIDIAKGATMAQGMSYKGSAPNS